MKKFFSTKTGSSSIAGSYENDASTDNEKWCRVNIVDATTEESDCTATTSLGMEQIDILDLEVAECSKKTNYDSQTLCF